MNMTTDQGENVVVGDAVQVLTPGAVLHKEREAQNRNIADVAKELRISRNKLIALEADQYEQLSCATFVKGYIRSYSKFLGLNDEQLIEQYYAYVKTQEGSGLLIEPELKLDFNRANLGFLGSVERQEPRVKIFIIVAFAAIIASLGLYFVFSGDSPDDQAALLAPTATSSSQIDAKDSVTVGQKNVAPLMDNAAQQESVAEAAAVSAEPAPSALPPVAKPIASEKTAAVLDQLVIYLTEECWVEVSDAKGDVLATELFAAGSSIELQGAAPFNVMLGNAAAASIKINGNEIDAKPRGGAKSLRLMVEAS